MTLTFDSEEMSETSFLMLFKVLCLIMYSYSNFKTCFNLFLLFLFIGDVGDLSHLCVLSFSGLHVLHIKLGVSLFD